MSTKTLFPKTGTCGLDEGNRLLADSSHAQNKSNTHSTEGTSFLNEAGSKTKFLSAVHKQAGPRSASIPRAARNSQDARAVLRLVGERKDDEQKRDTQTGEPIYE